MIDRTLSSLRKQGIMAEDRVLVACWGGKVKSSIFVFVKELVLRILSGVPVIDLSIQG